MEILIKMLNHYYINCFWRTCECTDIKPSLYDATWWRVHGRYVGFTVATGIVSLCVNKQNSCLCNKSTRISSQTNNSHRNTSHPQDDQILAVQLYHSSLHCPVRGVYTFSGWEPTGERKRERESEWETHPSDIFQILNDVCWNKLCATKTHMHCNEEDKDQEVED